jgi:hypothetical protein
MKNPIPRSGVSDYIVQINFNQYKHNSKIDLRENVKQNSTSGEDPFQTSKSKRAVFGTPSRPALPRGQKPVF